MEWLSDKEKRILLSALAREKKVCIEVDKQYEPREAYEQSLQSVCESLEHKFYYDRLFKQIRADAIDDFVNIAKEHDFKYGKNDITNCVIGFIEFFAEELKAGVKNGK